ncbi:TadE/TadG family type IV pilus assembly protein [Jannaschia aquimarina]|uniref:TadE-like protein n=2 Tax=Jannaschia aquimarina TaxID=935700 RepID=A0A0D1EI29_9RHOB|nr:TadE/TadG family type IV pilus assembly protein [Jannaschia aquimarina]KIT16551.1 TadE-like protein [Jannaschia aquimarina]SNT05888.1 TadE-like protein [Jannaschia aquimarina]
MSLLRQLWHRFKSEDGSSTVEFVIVFPIFIVVFLSSFEASLLLTRQLMLERGIDIVVRAIRLDPTPEPPLPDWTIVEVRRQICERALILPNCEASLRVELNPVSRATWDVPSSQGPCEQKPADFDAATDEGVLTVGGAEEITLVRVCYNFDPVFPHLGLGLALVKDQEEDTVFMMAASAFVSEPKKAPGP